MENKKEQTQFEKMVEFLDSAYILKSEIVPCLIGPVGIGKTAAVRQHAKNVGASNVVTIIASQILPNEVSGITMPDSETKAMEIYDHFRLSQLKDGDILFFDELLEADQLVLSACLTLIESRMLMSGRVLPDIQIIGATNPTIQPNVLKENIRQRFMFQKFNLDKQACHDYIKENVGLDVSQSILNELVCTGDEYNILSPRSLTKLSKWIMAAKDDKELDVVARTINCSWNSQIGSELAHCRRAANHDPYAQVKDSLKHAIKEVAADNFIYTSDIMFDSYIESSSISEIMEVLQANEWWDQLEAVLKDMDAPTDDHSQIDF